MAKFYKKIIFIDSTNPDLGLQSDQQQAEPSLRQKLSRWLALPAMIAGALVGMVFFSAFLLLLLVPLAIWAARRWWRLRKTKNTEDQTVIDGEYSVIDLQKPEQPR